MIAAVLLAAAAAAGPSDNGVLAPAWAGQVRCVVPDPVNRTCRAITRYDQLPDGTIRNTTKMLLAVDPEVTMTLATIVRVDGNAICGVTQPEEIAAAAVEIAGRPASAETADALRQQVAAVNVGHDDCSVVASANGDTVLRVTSDGVAVPGSEVVILWVWPDAGYRVAAPGRGRAASISSIGTPSTIG